MTKLITEKVILFIIWTSFSWS